MVRIRRFSAIRTANVVTLMYVIAMAIFLVPALLLMASYAVPAGGGGRYFGLLAGGAVALLIGAVLYAVATWIFTAIACLIYNLAARWVGGIELQVEQLTAPAPTASAGPPDWVPPSPG